MEWLRKQSRVPLPSLQQNVNSLLSNGLLALLLVGYVAVCYLLMTAVGLLLVDLPQGLDPLFWVLNTILPPWLVWSLFAGIALSVWPVGRWLHRRVNDLVYSQPDNPYALLTQLNQHLAEANAPAALLPTVVATLAATLKLPYVAIEATAEAAGGGATYGTLPPQTEITSIPLTYRGSTLGCLRVSARYPYEYLSASDTRLLTDLSRQVGITLHAAQLTAALQSSRQQLLLAQEEERRRIRRDLHDGLGPILAALAMQADTAQALIASDPATASELMAAVTSQAKEVVTEVRRLVYDLRPPALDELGLVGALRRLAQQHSTPTLPIDLCLPDVIPALAAAVEVAIYRIAAEALTNVLRHAHATRCTLQLAIGQDVTLTVADNGCGMRAQRESGIGLPSMRERAREVNGELTVDSTETGGTTLVAHLPLYTKDVL